MKDLSLLPCPFCGNAPSFYAYEDGWAAYLTVKCGYCWASSHSISYSIKENGLNDDHDPIPPEYRKLEVAQKWNTRIATQITTPTYIAPQELQK